MEITITKLEATYKGLVDFVLEPHASGALITGRNGAGKTCVIESVLWCLYGRGMDWKTEYSPENKETNEACVSIRFNTKDFLPIEFMRRKKNVGAVEYWVDGRTLDKKEFDIEVRRYLTWAFPFAFVPSIMGKIHWSELRDILLRVYKPELCDLNEEISSHGKKKKELEKELSEIAVEIAALKPAEKTFEEIEDLLEFYLTVEQKSCIIKEIQRSKEGMKILLSKESQLQESWRKEVLAFDSKRERFLPMLAEMETLLEEELGEKVLALVTENKSGKEVVGCDVLHADNNPSFGQNMRQLIKISDLLCDTVFRGHPVPLAIDNAESVDKPVQTRRQKIECRVADSDLHIGGVV